jgi:hypothetical protein
MLVLLMLVVGQVNAFTSGEEDAREFYTDPDEGQLWQEGALTIPALPQQDDLIPLQVEHPGFQFWIDPASLSVDENNIMVRYTLVLVSRGGARNIRYEGLRCDEYQYRTYAYGTGDKPLQAARHSEWKPISSGQRYHKEMVAYYLCQNGMALKKRDILQRIRYPEQGSDDSY